MGELKSVWDKYEEMVLEMDKYSEVLKRMGYVLELLVYPYLIEPNTVKNIVEISKNLKDINLSDYSTTDLLVIAQKLKKGEVP